MYGRPEQEGSANTTPDLAAAGRDGMATHASNVAYAAGHWGSLHPDMMAALSHITYGQTPEMTAETTQRVMGTHMLWSLVKSVQQHVATDPEFQEAKRRAQQIQRPRPMPEQPSGFALHSDPNQIAREAAMTPEERINKMRAQSRPGNAMGGTATGFQDAFDAGVRGIKAGVGVAERNFSPSGVANINSWFSSAGKNLEYVHNYFQPWGAVNPRDPNQMHRHFFGVDLLNLAEGGINRWWHEHHLSPQERAAQQNQNRAFAASNDQLVRAYVSQELHQNYAGGKGGPLMLDATRRRLAGELHQDVGNSPADLQNALLAEVEAGYVSPQALSDAMKGFGDFIKAQGDNIQHLYRYAVLKYQQKGADGGIAGLTTALAPVVIPMVMAAAFAPSTGGSSIAVEEALAAATTELTAAEEAATVAATAAAAAPEDVAAQSAAETAARYASEAAQRVENVKNAAGNGLTKIKLTEAEQQALGKYAKFPGMGDRGPVSQVLGKTWYLKNRLFSPASMTLGNAFPQIQHAIVPDKLWTVASAPSKDLSTLGRGLASWLGLKEGSGGYSALSGVTDAIIAMNEMPVSFGRGFAAESDVLNKTGSLAGMDGDKVRELFGWVPGKRDFLHIAAGRVFSRRAQTLKVIARWGQDTAGVDTEQAVQEVTGKIIGMWGPALGPVAEQLARVAVDGSERPVVHTFHAMVDRLADMADAGNMLERVRMPTTGVYGRIRQAKVGDSAIAYKLNKLFGQNGMYYDETEGLLRTTTIEMGSEGSIHALGQLLRQNGMASHEVNMILGHLAMTKDTVQWENAYINAIHDSFMNIIDRRVLRAALKDCRGDAKELTAQAKEVMKSIKNGQLVLVKDGKVDQELLSNLEHVMKKYEPMYHQINAAVHSHVRDLVNGTGVGEGKLHRYATGADIEDATKGGGMNGNDMTGAPGEARPSAIGANQLNNFKLPDFLQFRDEVGKLFDTLRKTEGFDVKYHNAVAGRMVRSSEWINKWVNNRFFKPLALATPGWAFRVSMSEVALNSARIGPRQMFAGWLGDGYVRLASGQIKAARRIVADNLKQRNLEVRDLQSRIRSATDSRDAHLVQQDKMETELKDAKAARDTAASQLESYRRFLADGGQFRPEEQQKFQIEAERTQNEVEQRQAAYDTYMTGEENAAFYNRQIAGHQERIARLQHEIDSIKGLKYEELPEPTVDQLLKAKVGPEVWRAACRPVIAEHIDRLSTRIQELRAQLRAADAVTPGPERRVGQATIDPAAKHEAHIGELQYQLIKAQFERDYWKGHLDLKPLRTGPSLDDMTREWVGNHLYNTIQGAWARPSWKNISTEAMASERGLVEQDVWRLLAEINDELGSKFEMSEPDLPGRIGAFRTSHPIKLGRLRMQRTLEGETQRTWLGHMDEFGSLDSGEWTGPVLNEDNKKFGWFNDKIWKPNPSDPLGGESVIRDPRVNDGVLGLDEITNFHARHFGEGGVEGAGGSVGEQASRAAEELGHLLKMHNDLSHILYRGFARKETDWNAIKEFAKFQGVSAQSNFPIDTFFDAAKRNHYIKMMTRFHISVPEIKRAMGEVDKWDEAKFGGFDPDYGDIPASLAADAKDPWEMTRSEFKARVQELEDKLTQASMTGETWPANPTLEESQMEQELTSLAGNGNDLDARYNDFIRGAAAHRLPYNKTDERSAVFNPPKEAAPARYKPRFSVREGVEDRFRREIHTVIDGSIRDLHERTLPRRMEMASTKKFGPSFSMRDRLEKNIRDGLESRGYTLTRDEQEYIAIQSRHALMKAPAVLLAAIGEDDFARAAAFLIHQHADEGQYKPDIINAREGNSMNEYVDRGTVPLDTMEKGKLNIKQQRRLHTDTAYSAVRVDAPGYWTGRHETALAIAGDSEVRRPIAQIYERLWDQGYRNQELYNRAVNEAERHIASMPEDLRSRFLRDRQIASHHHEQFTDENGQQSWRPLPGMTPHRSWAHVAVDSHEAQFSKRFVPSDLEGTTTAARDWHYYPGHEKLIHDLANDEVPATLEEFHNKYGYDESGNIIPTNLMPPTAITRHYAPGDVRYRSPVTGPTTYLHDKVLSKVVNGLSRNPTYIAEFVRARTALENRVIQGYITPDQADLLAQTGAAQRMVRFIHNPKDKTRFEEMMRVAAPFYFAQNQAWRRMGRLFAEDPGAFFKYVRMMMGVQQWIHKETDNNGMSVFTMPALAMWGMPMTASISSLQTIDPFAMPADADPSANTTTSLISLLTPKFGPVVTVPAKLIETGIAHADPNFFRNKYAQQARAFTEGDIAAQNSWWTTFFDAAVPNSFARQIVQGTVGTLMDSQAAPRGALDQFGTTFVQARMEAVRHIVSTESEAEWNRIAKLTHDQIGAELTNNWDVAAFQYKEMPDDFFRHKLFFMWQQSHWDLKTTTGQNNYQRVFDLANQRARWAWLAKMSAGLIMPVSMGLGNTDSNVTQDLNNTIKAAKGDYEKGLDEFLKKHPWAAVDTLYKTTSPSGGYFPESRTFFNWANQNLDLLKNHPAAAMAFAPNDLYKDTRYFGPSQHLELSLGLRQREAPLDFFNAFEVATGNAYYYNWLKPQYEKLKEQGIKHSVAYKWLQDQTTQYGTDHNTIWAGVHGAHPSMMRKTAALDDLGNLLSSGKVKGPNVEMIQSLYDAVVGTPKQMGLLGEANAAIKKGMSYDNARILWQDTMDQLIKQYPQLQQAIMAIFYHLV